MALRRSTFLSLAAAALMSSPAGALEVFAKGVGVTQELTDSHGHRFAITFRPPAGRALDPRILNAFEISISSNAADAGATVSRGAEVRATAESDGDPIDVSGYTIDVEAVSLANCSAEVRIAKSRPGVLEKLYKVIIRATGAASLSVMAFPLTGNVDVDVNVNDSVRCASSKKPEGTLDVAACALPSCNSINDNDSLVGTITSPRTSSNARYVGVVTIVFAN